jgi:hypothetical protein
MDKHAHGKAILGLILCLTTLASVFWVHNEEFKRELKISTAKPMYDAKAQLIAAGVIKE